MGLTFFNRGMLLLSSLQRDFGVFVLFFSADQENSVPGVGVDQVLKATAIVMGLTRPTTPGKQLKDLNFFLSFYFSFMFFSLLGPRVHENLAISDKWRDKI